MPAGRGCGRGRGRRDSEDSSQETQSFELYRSEGGTYQNAKEFRKAIQSYSKVMLIKY